MQFSQSSEVCTIKSASAGSWVAFINASVALAGFVAELGFFSVVEDYVQVYGGSFSLGSAIRIILSIGFVLIIAASISVTAVAHQISQGNYYSGNTLVSALLWCYAVLMVIEVIAMITLFILYASGIIISWEIVCQNELKSALGTTIVTNCAKTLNLTSYILLVIAIVVVSALASQSAYFISRYRSDSRAIRDEERVYLVRSVLQ